MSTFHAMHPDDVAAPKWARTAVADALKQAGVGQSRRSHWAVLVVSELVTNVVRHTDSVIGLNVAIYSDSLLRIEVVDTDGRAPVRRPRIDRDPPDGWGLNIVQRLALDWGFEPRRDRRVGKVVWAELALC